MAMDGSFREINDKNFTFAVPDETLEMVRKY